jgi:glycosyltransferase involved in cell wall biosynthesis
MRGFPEYLDDNGWEVHVVCSPGPTLDARAQHSKVTFHALKMHRNTALVHDLRALVAWVRLCREVRPDLISVGTPKAALLGGLAGWIAGVPRRVYHQRGLRLETSKGFQRKVLGLSERITVKAAHIVLAVSPSLRDLMLRLRLSTPDKIVVVGAGSSNGVDLREFDPKRFKADDKSRLRASLGLRVAVPTIGYVGRLTRDKGFNVLEDAVRQLKSMGTDFDLLIVGGVDDPASRRTLERLLDSDLSVKSTGTVNDPAIYYQLMDMLCLPTYREGYPNVVLEASASGKATVTTDATGAIDSVIPGITGSIVPMGDSQTLAHELNRLLNVPGELETMGDQARQHVEKHFDRPKVWNQLLQFYNLQYERSVGEASGVENRAKTK